MQKRHAGFKLARKSKEWLRDFCADGEPKPGPSCSSKKKGRPTTIWTGGAKGTRVALKVIVAEKPHVVFLQETARSTKEAQAFIRAAERKGYNAYSAGAQDTGPSSHGGAMLPARKEYRAQPAKAHSSMGGAFQGSVYVAGRLFKFVSAYFAPVAASEEVAQTLAALVLALPARVAWCIGEDSNTLPKENTFAEAFSGNRANLLCPQKAR